MKSKYKFLSVMVVTIFLISITTAMIDAESQNLNKDNNNSIYPVLDSHLLEEDQCNCRLLNGKYAVMTDRDIKPKTFIPDEDPMPTGSFDNLPSQFSWKNYGGDWMTPVKDQGSCGSCWDFSALGTMEAAINIASGYPDTDIDLSEQYVLSCLPYGGSCNGGWTDDAFEAIISTSSSIGNGINGVPLESCMPYQAVDWIPCSDKCEDWDIFHTPPQTDDILWQLEDWGANHNFNNNDPNDRDIVKSWIMDKGPISSSMYATSAFSSYWDSHHNPNDWFYEANHGYTNHAVVLLGWNDDPEVTNGGYWILKNSWGTNWGYGGYFNAAYGGQDIARIVRWCKTFDWPGEQSGPGPMDFDMAVFSNFRYESEYPHPGDKVLFTDISDGDVALREWDFNGDGIIDSTQKNPSYTYYEEGVYEVILTVQSAWGLHSNRTKIVEVKENWPPIIDGLPYEFVGYGLSYHFDARYCYDPDGNIESYHWDFDDGTTSDEQYLYHTFPKPDVIYVVTLTLTDEDGGTSSEICNLKIDQTVPPVTEILHRGYFELKDWYGDTQRIYFTSSDWTEVIDTFYRVDGGDWNKYVPSEQEFIPISSEGEHTVECYSVDYWLNEESIVSETFFIDKTDPTLDVNIVGGEQINGWYTSKVSVELFASDDYSGVEEISYKVDNDFWMDYTGSFTIDDGRHQLWVFAVDKAGNSYEELLDINVDSSDPSTNIFLYGEGDSSDNRFYKDVEIRLAASDMGSGVKEIFYRLDDAPMGYSNYYQPLTIDLLGEHVIEYYSVDYIGNQESVKTTVFTLSNVNFDLTIISPTNGLYIFGVRLLPIQKTILIGSAEFQVSIESFTQESANVDHVDFLLDGEVVKTFADVGPYVWIVDQQIMGRYTIQIKAYTPDDEIISDQITVTLLII